MTKVSRCFNIVCVTFEDLLPNYIAFKDFYS